MAVRLSKRCQQGIDMRQMVAGEYSGFGRQRRPGLDSTAKASWRTSDNLYWTAAV